YCEDVGKVAIESVSPEVSASRGVDELAGDPDPVARLAYTSLDHVVNAKLAADLLYVDRLAFVGESRISGDDVQLLEFGEVGDDVLSDAIGKILLLGVSAHIVERKDGDRRLYGRLRPSWRFRVHRRSRGGFIYGLGLFPHHPDKADSFARDGTD